MMSHLNRRRRPRGNRQRRRIGGSPACAALDLGTNNCRLLVAIPAERDGFKVVDAFSRIVRLGEGIGRDGVLSDAAMQRTVDALQVCAAKMRRSGVVRARGVATEACRRASNCDSFLDMVSARTGLTIETISSEEEVRLVLQGCLPLLEDAPAPAPAHAIVFDIGGGSTEVVWSRLDGGRPEIVDWISMPLGVVTLTEEYGEGPMTAAVYGRIIEEVESYLAPFCARHGIAAAVAGGAVKMLGTSGTVTTLCGVQLGLRRYDRTQVDGAYLVFDAIEGISERLRGLDCADRAAYPCIGVDRADLVVAGCAVLEAICRRWPVGRLRVADRGIREGILCELMSGLAAADAGSAGSAAAGGVPAERDDAP